MIAGSDLSVLFTRRDTYCLRSVIYESAKSAVKGIVETFSSSNLLFDSITDTFFTRNRLVSLALIGIQKVMATRMVIHNFIGKVSIG